MKVLIACEYSGRVRNEFAKLGYDAWSCDLLKSETPGNHIQDDIRNVINKKWDIVIGHPPCTRLTNSVYWYIKKHNLEEEVKEAAELFNIILNCNAKHIAVENPIMNREAKKYIRRQDQIIQPYRFGENAKKGTGLWLKNLPLLKPTGYWEPRLVNGVKRWGNQTDGGWEKTPPGPDRWKIRSLTYQGIAEAMATQWNDYLKKVNQINKIIK